MRVAADLISLIAGILARYCSVACGLVADARGLISCFAADRLGVALSLLTGLVGLASDRLCFAASCGCNIARLGPRSLFGSFEQLVCLRFGQAQLLLSILACFAADLFGFLLGLLACFLEHTLGNLASLCFQHSPVRAGLLRGLLAPVQVP